MSAKCLPKADIRIAVDFLIGLNLSARLVASGWEISFLLKVAKT